jgi:hypothetical protein
MTNLNDDQLIQLKKKFCLELTENMDIDTLCEIVFDQLMQSYDDYDQEEMKEEVISYYCGAEEDYQQWVNEINPYTTANPEAVTDYGVGK